MDKDEKEFKDILNNLEIDSADVDRFITDRESILSNISNARNYTIANVENLDENIKNNKSFDENIKNKKSFDENRKNIRRSKT